MYLLADKFEDLNSVQKRIIETQKNHSMVLMRALDIIQINSGLLMACSQLFHAREQMPQVQASLLGSFSALLNELKMYRVAIYSYELTILNSVMNMINKLIPNGEADGHASQYVIESDFIAGPSTQKIALLSQDEINRYVGSSSFVCINGFSLETARDTGLGSLLVYNHLTALQKCEIKTLKLPLKEKARNLGRG